MDSDRQSETVEGVIRELLMELESTWRIEAPPTVTAWTIVCHHDQETRSVFRGMAEWRPLERRIYLGELKNGVESRVWWCCPVCGRKFLLVRVS